MDGCSSARSCGTSVLGASGDPKRRRSPGRGARRTPTRCRPSWISSANSTTSALSCCSCRCRPRRSFFQRRSRPRSRYRFRSPRLDLVHHQFYERLRTDGVDVLDLTDLFIAERFHPDGPLYCRTDTHWSGTGCTVAAAAIADRIRRRMWYDELDTQPYTAAWYSTTITGDLTREGGVPGPQEELRLRGVVTGAGQDRTRVSPDPASPIVLLGDSHNLVFHAGDDMHATGAGPPGPARLRARPAARPGGGSGLRRDAGPHQPAAPSPGRS